MNAPPDPNEDAPVARTIARMALVADFYGLGAFGQPIALHLHEAGVTVQPRVTGGRGQAGVDAFNKRHPPSAIRRPADVAILCLPRTTDVIEAIDRMDALPPVIIDLTTGTPSLAAGLHLELAGHDTFYVDAPVSGSLVQARNGELTVFVGADDGLPPLAAEILERIGTPWFFGHAGQGCAAKLANQMIHITNVAVLGEAAEFARCHNIDVEHLFAACAGSSAASAMLDRFGEHIALDIHDPLFTVSLALKDIDTAVGAAGCPLRYTTMTRQLLLAACDNGSANRNFTALTQSLNVEA